MASIRSSQLFQVVTIMIFLAAGCRSISPDQTGHNLPTHTVEVSQIDTRTSVPSTSTPSPTPRPPTITLTLTPTFTLTPTSEPTLDRTHVSLLVEDLLVTNGNCLHPCFWGLVPGKTTYDEVRRFFQHLGRKDDYTEKNARGEIVHYDTSFRVKDAIPVSIVLELKSEVVENISIFIGGFYEPGVSREDWSAYSLKSMLQVYGVPTKVGFSVSQPTEPPFNTGLVGYSYIVFFEEPNVTYFFQGGQIRAGKSYRVCPMSPKEYASFSWLFIGKNPYGDFSGWVDLSEATTLTPEDFYKLFTQGDDGTCLNLDAEAFMEGSP